MIWHLRDFELDDTRFELRRNGERVVIAPKPLELLLHLAKRHPASVSSEELLRSVWPGVRVTNASLARAVMSARRALGDASGENSLIRTIRGRGYALTESCVPLVSSPGCALSTTEPPFVGRCAELARIETALDNVEIGRGRLLFIGGEPGIGKTRLLEELASRALERRATVVTAHCSEEEGAGPYWPWPDILRGLEAQRDHRPECAERVRLHLESRDAARAAFGDADARFQLFLDVTDTLRQAAAGHMLVLLIENLRWAGADALGLLRFAGRSLARSSILIAATYRSSGPTPNRLLESIIGELGAVSHAVPGLRLTGLSPGEVATYLRYVTGEPPNAALVQRLHEATDGNPLLLSELIPLCAAPNPAAEPTNGTPAPSGVTHLLRSHLRCLKKPTRHLLETAAVIGSTFKPEFLAKVSGRRLEKVLEHIDEARKENLLVWHGHEDVRFRHLILRSALLEGLPIARRLALEQRIPRANGANGKRETNWSQITRLSETQPNDAEPARRRRPRSTPVRYLARSASNAIASRSISMKQSSASRESAAQARNRRA